MMYDAPTQHIQVWKYDLEKGWMQIGKDLSVKFAEGDVFTDYMMQAQSYSVTISYDYDDLYRLTEANYSNGDYYHYGYDAIGNRRSQESMVSNQSSVISYQYDYANRLTNVGSIEYT